MLHDIKLRKTTYRVTVRINYFKFFIRDYNLAKYSEMHYRTYIRKLAEQHCDRMSGYRTGTTCINKTKIRARYRCLNL
jgi:hypothetical protein